MISKYSLPDRLGYFLSLFVNNIVSAALSISMYSHWASPFFVCVKSAFALGVRYYLIVALSFDKFESILMCCIF